MLAYDLSSNALIKSLEKEYGKQRSLQYLNKIVQIMNKAGEDWDNCKTIDDNMSKLIGDLTQMLATDVFITRMMKNQSLKAQFLATSFSDIIQEFLGYKDISLGNLTQNLYRLSWEAENYFKGLQDTEAQLRADWDTLPEDIKIENTKQGLAPGLPGWIAKVNEMNQKQKQDYEKAVKKIFSYSQIPIEIFRNFAYENGTNETSLIKINNLLKTKDGGYILVPEDGKLTLPNGEFAVLPFVCDTKTNQQIKTQNSQNLNFSNGDKNDKFTNLQNIVSNETASNSQNSQTSCHSKSLTRHSELSKESEESQINLQNVNSQTSQNTLKMEFAFTEKYVIKDFAHKLYGVKMPETKQRIGIDAATQCKISFLLDTISEHKRQIVQTCGEKTWQKTFENFQKTNDIKVFENALKSQIPNENANLKNSENNITNPQENGNNFKM